MNLFSEVEQQYETPTTSISPVSSLFSKYENLKPTTPVTLFEVDCRIAVVQKRCPYCYCKLYEMRNKPFYYCKSNSHKNKFLISKDKIII